MTLVDASRCRIDDHEHFSSKILAAPIKNHTGYGNRFGLIRMRALVELERRETVLAVYNQKFLFRFLQISHRLGSVEGLKAKFLWIKKQICSRDGRLRDGGRIEIAD